MILWENICLLLDPQKQALYSWESAWADWCRSTLTIPEVRSLVRKACKTYGVTPPSVSAHTGNMWSTYDPETASISFERTQRNTAIALHEATHHILFTICMEEAAEESDGNFEDHGKEFLGIYLRLLRDAGVAPLIALTASATAAGLDFISVRAAEPTRFRRHVAKVLS
jgi:hypothetical protein